VVSKVVGYKKIKFYTSENLGYGDVNLPEKDMHTTSYWFTIPRDRLAGLSYNRRRSSTAWRGSPTPSTIWRR